MKSMTYKVYRLINVINGKVYIGVTKKSVKSRLSGHFSAFRSSMEKGMPLNRLQKAFRKHGIECWIVDTMKDKLTQDEAFAEEVTQIARHGSFGRKGYNATAGGIGQNHVVWTEYSKQKLSISLKAKWKRDPQIVSLETRQLQSEVKKKNHVRAVKIFFRGIEYPSFREAERQTGISLHKIRAELCDEGYTPNDEKSPAGRTPSEYTTKDGTFASRQLAAEHYKVSIHNLAGYLKRNKLTDDYIA